MKSKKNINAINKQSERADAELAKANAEWAGFDLRYPLPSKWTCRWVDFSPQRAKTLITVEMLRERHEYEWLFGITDGPDRAKLLKELEGEMTPEVFWSWVRKLWIQDGCGEIIILQEFLKRGHEVRRHLMSDEEITFLVNLPSLLTIYRGTCPDDESLSWSWSLDRKIAAKFARRKSEWPWIIDQAVCNRDDVLAYFQQRYFEESEIVIHPEDVKVSKRITISF